MAPAGASDTSVSDACKYPVVTQMRVLGHYLQHDGSTVSCFQHCVNSMWRAFFQNCAGRAASKLSVRSRCRLLNKAVLPILRFHCTRWPFSITRAAELDRIQRRMLSIILGCRPLPDEPIETFVRRRGREAGNFQRNIGCWSIIWASAVVKWSQHLRRRRNDRTWAAMLACVMDPDILLQRRSDFSGRPRTRASPGFIFKRWWEAVRDASTFV